MQRYAGFALAQKRHVELPRTMKSLPESAHTP